MNKNHQDETARQVHEVLDNSLIPSEKPKFIQPRPVKVVENKKVVDERLQADFKPLLSNLNKIKKTLLAYDPSKLTTKLENINDTIDFEASPVEIDNLEDDALKKYNFLTYIKDVLIEEKPEVFKPISIIPCHNSVLPIQNHTIKGMYLDELNATVWISMSKLTSEKAKQLALDFSKIFSLQAKENEITALSILAKDVYVSRYDEENEKLDLQVARLE